jgi:hypothetical protein
MSGVDEPSLVLYVMVLAFAGIANYAIWARGRRAQGVDFGDADHAHKKVRAVQLLMGGFSLFGFGVAAAAHAFGHAVGVLLSLVGLAVAMLVARRIQRNQGVPIPDNI